MYPIAMMCSENNRIVASSILTQLKPRIINGGVEDLASKKSEEN